MAESADVGHSLRNIRDAGYSLYLRVDCQREGASEEQITVPARGLPQPSFQINGDDLNFLRSIGIDPTRRLRRRKSSKQPGRQPAKQLSEPSSEPSSRRSSERSSKQSSR